jgi:Protein of unknown function (DUF3301)
MIELFWVLLISGGLALLWRTSVDARAIALEAAQRECEGAGLQLLDGAVVFKSWRFARDAGSRLGLERTYLFDYTDDGSSRRQGFVILRGHRVELVGLGPTLVRNQLQ